MDEVLPLSKADGSEDCMVSDVKINVAEYF